MTAAFYEGLIGTVYAAAIAGQRFGEDTVFTRIVAESGGTALELGSGTGRLLLRLLGAGHDVHGLEISEQMIATCLAEARRLGLRPTVHRGSFAPLDLDPGHYSVVYCPLNAFSFIVDDALALESVRSYAAALRPGGVLALAGSAGEPRALRAPAGWVRRDDVPIGAGRVAQVREHRTVQTGGCMRIERVVRTVGPDGEEYSTEEGTQLRRLRPIADLAGMFGRCGFTGLRAFGGDADYVLIGRKERPAT
ncbi:class I SAM-dependent methyltransferase [Nonomuraea sp. NPDC050643]|uniref:class I SAM-dependent methyltransferase n=1 Tax=Nonomuraea sp. NPDC050643 TaxID=3155660 RepID=UPI0033CFE667